MIVAQQPAVPLCTMQEAVAPKTWTLACGDGNFRLTGLEWKHWGSARASATGTAHANDCTPNCAAGHFHTHAVVVTVSGAKTCAGRRQYVKLTLSYPGRRSPLFEPRTETMDCRFP